MHASRIHCPLPIFTSPKYITLEVVSKLRIFKARASCQRLLSRKTATKIIFFIFTLHFTIYSEIKSKINCSTSLPSWMSLVSWTSLVFRTSLGLDQCCLLTYSLSSISTITCTPFFGPNKSNGLRRQDLQSFLEARGCGGNGE